MTYRIDDQIFCAIPQRVHWYRGWVRLLRICTLSNIRFARFLNGCGG